MAIDTIQKGIQYDDWRLEIDSATDVDELVLMASRAELTFTGTPEAHAALRNMSRVFNAAAARLSFLEAYNTIAP